MPSTTPHHVHPPHPPDPQHAAGTWRRVLDALWEAGAAAGRDAADRWQQDTLGGRASGDTTARAAAILAGLDDVDPAIVDALPTCDLSGHRADQPTHADVYRDGARVDAPDWDDLDPHARDEAIDACRDGYHIAVLERVAAHCRRAVDADGRPGADDGRPLPGGPGRGRS